MSIHIHRILLVDEIDGIEHFIQGTYLHGTIIGRSTCKGRKDQMENNQKLVQTSFQRASQQLPITLTQLMRASIKMRHIDEFLSWLASLMVRGLNIQVIQFWANQATFTNQNSIVLRASALQDGSLPSHVVVNARVVELVEILFREQRGVDLQQVHGIFSSHQAHLLNRYGLNYCFGHFQHNSSLLPPLAHAQSSNENVATPFAMLALLFWRQLPLQSTLPNVTTILDKVEPAAKHGNLLLPPNGDMYHHPVPSDKVQHQHVLSGSELIPRRARELEALREYSPFSRATPIQSREAQRLYQAIDGRRNLAELAAFTRLNTRGLEKALHLLVTQNLVQVCNKTGQAIEGPWLRE
jgi:hypothetical protein